MPIKKPYNRIYRPIANSFSTYVLDNRYASDRASLCLSYKILEKDFKKFFEYVNPSDSNLNTYSHRIYELFLRTSTEFETNCKQILCANSYGKTKNLTINDYHKINKATKLSDYEVCINIWESGKKIIKPFAAWSNGASLQWYQDYNVVKHNRNQNFAKSNLENLLNAMAAIYAILYAQFGAYSFNPYNEINMIEDNFDGTKFLGESIFSIKPISWDSNDEYDFDWETLKNTPDPLDKFSF